MNRNIALAIAATVLVLVALTMGEDGPVDRIADGPPVRQEQTAAGTAPATMTAVPQRRVTTGWAPSGPQPIEPQSAAPMVEVQGLPPQSLAPTPDEMVGPPPEPVVPIR